MRGLKIHIDVTSILCSIAVSFLVWHEKYMPALTILMCLALAELSHIRRILEDEE